MRHLHFANLFHDIEKDDNFSMSKVEIVIPGSLYRRISDWTGVELESPMAVEATSRDEFPAWEVTEHDRSGDAGSVAPPVAETKEEKEEEEKEKEMKEGEITPGHGRALRPNEFLVDDTGVPTVVIGNSPVAEKSSLAGDNGTIEEPGEVNGSSVGSVEGSSVGIGEQASGSAEPATAEQASGEQPAAAKKRRNRKQKKHQPKH